LVVQALKALGKEHVDGQVIEVLRKRLDIPLCERILKDGRTATGWIYGTIKRACDELA
jgi:hypothetical protein